MARASGIGSLSPCRYHPEQGSLHPGPLSHVLEGHHVCYRWHMRLHIALDDDLVAELDRRVGPRRRSAFIAELIRRGLDDERRWDDIESALGALAGTAHYCDADVAGWVHDQRRGGHQRVG